MREHSSWSGWNLSWNFAHLQSPSSNDCTHLHHRALSWWQGACGLEFTGAFQQTRCWDAVKD
jgi:hypothetical protein